MVFFLKNSCRDIFKKCLVRSTVFPVESSYDSNSISVCLFACLSDCSSVCPPVFLHTDVALLSRVNIAAGPNGLTVIVDNDTDVTANVSRLNAANFDVLEVLFTSKYMYMQH